VVAAAGVESAVETVGGSRVVGSGGVGLIDAAAVRVVVTHGQCTRDASRPRTKPAGARHNQRRNGAGVKSDPSDKVGAIP
jgi:hypothetical protein